MRKIIMYSVFGIAILLNIYLIFVWTPEESVISGKSEATVYTYSPMKSVNMDEIVKGLSDDEKETLKLTLEKLSTFDMENIEEDLNKGDEESVREAFVLMNRRLPSDDYKRVKEILGEFINIDQI